ncbi:hypothetical protein P691DRAFT_672060 [Macrolepiota fuliginosa MF-IS2]|uniref:F-box domain-containing protein n=1 Tax=Macrolepiota fuliginosa MF-IS2 TaxID=1400762 RepID=A0A9P5XBV2_9AGAR|nr:hypothetical protein P691DRAFT_672060 [Macrolepiota fuliginosa MF-IS2]
MHFTPHTPHSPKRILLEEEETRLAAELSAIRSQMNELAPVSVLPTEILEQVFSICVSWLYSPKKPRHRLAWTQVCRQWRTLSFNSLRLWQCIDLTDSRFAREFLARSRAAPISIFSASPLKVCTEDLVIHTSRLHSIDVFLFPDDMLDLFTSLGPNLFSLTSLSLKIPPVSSTFILDTPIPSIRRLSLDCVAVHWDALADLTHLTLRGLCPKFSPSVTQIHEIFSRSPLLEYVRLDSIRPEDLDAPNQTLTLPHLRDLIISAKAPIITAILSRMSLAPTTRLQLTCASFDDLRTFFPRGLPFEVPINHLHIEGLRFARHASRFLRVNARPWSDDPQDIQFTLDSVSCIATPFLSSLPIILNLSQITFLEFNTGVLLDLSLSSLQSFLAHTCNVETIRIAFNVLQDLLNILTHPNPETQQLLLPNLSQITFSRPGDLWWHFTDHWLRSITHCVKSRKARGCPLKTLEFIKCHGATLLALSEIQQIVPEIVITEPFEARRPSSASLFAGSF